MINIFYSQRSMQKYSLALSATCVFVVHYDKKQLCTRFQRCELLKKPTESGDESPLGQPTPVSKGIGAIGEVRAPNKRRLFEMGRR